MGLIPHVIKFKKGPLSKICTISCYKNIYVVD